MRVAEGRERDDRYFVVVTGPDAAGRLDPVDGLHLEVHEHDVRPATGRVEALDRLERLHPSFDVADDVEIGLTAQEGQEPAAHNGVVVDDEHPDAVGLRRHRESL